MNSGQELEPIVSKLITLSKLYILDIVVNNDYNRKNSDIFVLFRPVQASKTGVPIHSNGKGGGGRWRWNMQSTISNHRGSTKKMNLRKPKEALLYPSDHIWRQSKSIGNAMFIDR